MSESTQQGGSGRRDSRPVGTSVVPCPLHGHRDAQLVVLVTSATGPLEGVRLKLSDAKKKAQEGVSGADGTAAFTKLAPGTCKIETALSDQQAASHLPVKLSAEISSGGGAAAAVLKLPTCSLAVVPKITCTKPAGLFDPQARTSVALLVELALTFGNPDALNGIAVSIRRNRDGVEMFSDAACTKPLALVNHVAALDAETLRHNPVNVWVRPTSDGPVLLTLSTARAAVRAKTGPVGEPGPPGEVRLEWRTPVVTPSIDTVPEILSAGSPYKVEYTLTDKDSVLVSATLELHDSTGALTHEIVKLDLTAPRVRTDSGKYEISWDGKLKGNVALDKAPYQLILKGKDRFARDAEVVKPIKILPPFCYLQLEFHDPDAVARPLPEGLPVQVVFEDKSILALTIGKAGALLGEKGAAELRLDPEKKSFTLRFPKSEKYLLCEPRGGTVVVPVLKTKDEVKAWVAEVAAEKHNARAFLLPRADWGLEDSVWAVTADGGAFVADKHHFTLAHKPLGTKDAPVKLVLDPRWQFARFTYQDRFRKGVEQVSSLPLFVEGFATAPASPVPAEALVTRSNWTIGDSPEKAIQCVPWIVKDQAPAKVKPDASSELRFETAASTFIETPAEKDKPRLLAAGTEHKEPNAARLRFYDLPKEWRSRNWYVRKTPLGKDATGAFFGELDTVPKVLGTKAAPLIFSLDDLVLYLKPAGAGLAAPLPALVVGQDVAIFHHTFAKGTNADLSAEGVFLPIVKPAKTGTLTIEQVRWPASKATVFTAAGVVKKPKYENYLTQYPDWTRLVIAEGNIYDVFSERSIAKDDTQPERVVGARAAICWHDATAPIPNVTPAGGSAGTHPPVPGNSITPRPVAVKTPFLNVQSFFEIQRPMANNRMDVYLRFAAGVGTASTEATDFGVPPNRASAKMEEWKANTEAANSQIGRFDSTLIRCCGVDEKVVTHEKAVQLNYFRLSCQFDTTTVHNDDGKKATWIETAMAGMSLRWNGPDGTYNPGRAEIEPRDQKTRLEKITIEVLRFCQNVPDDKANIRFQVIGKKPGARDFMGTFNGITQAQDGNEKVASDGSYTAAHEMGHGGGLLDDYCELWNHASYSQPGVPMLVPGDPYIHDNVSGSESMMHGNQQVRGRHFWHMAEWTRGQLKDETDLQIIHGGAAPYFLPHHTANRKADTTFVRSFLTYPWTASLDLASAADANDKARYDAYLWALGNDVFSKTVLPGEAGDTSDEAYDSQLIIAVSICLNFDALVDHELIQTAAGAVITRLRTAFSNRCMATLEVGAHKFERCLIVISPRIIVGTHTGDETYDTGLGIDANAKAPRWLGGNVQTVGSMVAPSVNNAFVYKCSKLLAGTGPKLTGGVEPAWPTSKGAKINDNKIEWTAVPAAEARKPLFEELLKEKLVWAPLHVVVEVGAGTSEIVKLPVTVLPRIKIVSAELEVWRETNALVAQAQKVIEATLLLQNAEQSVLEGKYNAAVSAEATAESVFAPLLLDWEQKRDAAGTKAGEYNTLHAADHQDPGLPAIQVEYNRLLALVAPALALAQQKETIRDAKEVLRETATTNWSDAANALNLISTSTALVALLGKVKEVSDALFTAATNPLTDAGFTDLTTQVGLLTAEASRSGATRQTLLAKLSSVKVPVVACKQALELFTKLSPLADLAKLGGSILKIAQKIEAWAKMGTDDPTKKKRADEAKKVLDSLYGVIVSSRTKRYDAQCAQTNGWSVLDYTDLTNVASADRACADEVVWDVKQAYLENVPSSLDEQLVKHFATWLGLEADVDSIVGYDKLVESVAETGKPVVVTRIKPPTAPPPPIIPVMIGPVNAPRPRVVASLAEQLAAVRLTRIVQTPPVVIVT